MSLDVNKTGALERAEFLMFVAQWYGLPGVLGDGGDDNGSIYTRGERRDYDDDCDGDYDGDYDGDEYGGGDDNNAGGNTVDGASEPISEKEALLRAKRAAKQATLTVEAAALIAAEPGERLGVLGSVGIVNEEDDDALKAAAAADAESVADAEAEEAAAAETRAMQDEFIASYVQRAGVSLPLHLVEFLGLLRSGSPDDAEKGAVHELWNRLVRAREARRQAVRAWRRSHLRESSLVCCWFGAVSPGSGRRHRD